MTPGPGRTPDSHLTVVLGGARSGKSSLAVRRGTAHESAGGSVTFIATSPRIAGDVDLDLRITAHRAERPPTWATVEEETQLANAIADSVPGALVIVDCLTLWVSNLLHLGAREPAISAATAAAIDAILERTGPTLVISNEVGLGIVPLNDVARQYRDLLGRVNQQFVAASRQAFFMVAGRALALTGIENL